MTADRFVFDGVAGSFLSTPDVNLLDADTAHIVQSVGSLNVTIYQLIKCNNISTH